MGQHQLLLIVLGLIIVGLAIVVGINLFKSNAIDVKRDALINDCLSIATLAQQHFKKPGPIGGGNNSFDGSGGGSTWSIPSQLTSNANGWFQIISISRREIVIRATGNEVVTGNDSVQVSVTITPDSITAAIIK